MESNNIYKVITSQSYYEEGKNICAVSHDYFPINTWRSYNTSKGILDNFYRRYKGFVKSDGSF